MSTTILIVDDNEDIRFTLREICDYVGWQVVEAHTGKQGVERFSYIRPDLVLLDYHMPDWDGIRATRELRKIDKRVPIIILTVDERQDVADTFLNAGATDFALKPIKAPDLISRIKINLKIVKLSGNNSSAFVEKGISQTTLQSIKEYLINQDNPSTINEIQQSLPIAYQTVHRYLNYMENKGEVEIISEYGRPGRPKNKYKLV
ncbi:PleD family two-component system response regulator [Virgibacillus kekensis]|uniref:PleD family two-component system response regulator n=1 Tax=Virgibacillus kekensis TaxID=202261 RepID=A0ABV9DI48_9BACI